MSVRAHRQPEGLTTRQGKNKQAGNEVCWLGGGAGNSLPRAPQNLESAPKDEGPAILLCNLKAVDVVQSYPIL